ncbi:MAG: glutamine synthetase [Proteobacteria bacterium]|nr:glutamine synthetase [Pseudomonadota bacterium]
MEKPNDLEIYLADAHRGELVARVRALIDGLGVDYIYYQYVSITGRIMGKAVPARHWESMAVSGVQTSFGGMTNSAVDSDGRKIGYGANSHELTAMPDPETFCQLPWNKRVARVFCTCFREREDSDRPGMLLERDVRGNLRRIDDAFRRTHDGLHMRVGCEQELLWLKPGAEYDPALGITSPNAYHIRQFEKLSEVWLRVYDYAVAMGLDVIQGDHEDAPGLVELNFMYDDALRTADRLTTYRQICAQVADEFGLIAMFMPKLYQGVAGNGCHHNVSLWTGGEGRVEKLVGDPLPGMDEVFTYSGGGRNELCDPDGANGLSDIGRHAVGGILEHLGALTAIACSTVNSYRRLNDLGKWTPVDASWGPQNRSCSVRYYGSDRFEFRPADSLVNPYLMQAALLRAMDDGITNRIDPGEPETRERTYLLRSGEAVREIPETLRDALDALAADEVVRSALPGDLYEVYDRCKRAEWRRFVGEVSDWDVKNYMDALP